MSQCLAKKSQFCTVWRHLNGPHWSPRSAPLAKDEDTSFIPLTIPLTFSQCLISSALQNFPVHMTTKARTSWKFIQFIVPMQKHVHAISVFVQVPSKIQIRQHSHTHVHTPLLSKNAILSQHHGAGCVFFHFKMLNPHASRTFGKWGWHCRSKSGFGLGQSKSKYVKVKLNTSKCKGPHDAEVWDFAIAWMPFPIEVGHENIFTVADPPAKSRNPGDPGPRNQCKQPRAKPPNSHGQQNHTN